MSQRVCVGIVPVLLLTAVLAACGPSAQTGDDDGGGTGADGPTMTPADAPVAMTPDGPEADGGNSYGDADTDNDGGCISTACPSSPGASPAVGGSSRPLQGVAEGRYPLLEAPFDSLGVELDLLLFKDIILEMRYILGFLYFH